MRYEGSTFTTLFGSGKNIFGTRKKKRKSKTKINRTNTKWGKAPL